MKKSGVNEAVERGDLEAKARSQVSHLARKIHLNQRMHLADLYKERPKLGEALAWLGVQFSLAALMASAHAWASGHIHWPIANFVLYLLVAFFIGSRFRALGNALHECSHGTFVQSAKANRNFGMLLAWIDLGGFDAYRKEHTSHHAYLGDPHRDEDFAARKRYFTRRDPFWLLHLVRPLTLFHLPTYLRPQLWSRHDTRKVVVARAVFYLTTAAFAHFAIGWHAFGLYVLLPYATTYQIFRYWSDAFDHAGLMENADELHRSCNHPLRSRALTLLIFPRNDQFHLVHHLFPSLPTRAFPEAHRRLIAAEPEYAAAQAILRQESPQVENEPIPDTSPNRYAA